MNKDEGHKKLDHIYDHVINQQKVSSLILLTITRNTTHSPDETIVNKTADRS